MESLFEPKVYYEKDDSRNVLAVIINVAEHSFYQFGILKQFYAKFTVCLKNSVRVEDIPPICCDLAGYRKQPQEVL